MKIYSPLQWLVILSVVLMVAIRMRSMTTFDNNGIGYLTKDGEYGVGLCLHCYQPFLILEDKQATAPFPKRANNPFKRAWFGVVTTWGGLGICKRVIAGELDDE